MLFYARKHPKAQLAVVIFLRGATKDWESQVSNWVRDEWFITVPLCFTDYLPFSLNMLNLIVLEYICKKYVP